MNKTNNKQEKIKKEEIGVIEDMEDVTKYGEFVTSYFAWLTPEKQKQKAEEMEKKTK